MGHHAARHLTMAPFPFRRFTVCRRRPDGSFDLTLTEDQRGAISSLLGELDDLIGSDPDDPGLRRLRPPAYPDDPEKNAEYLLLAGDELREARREAIATVRSSLERTVLDEAEVWAWLRAITALRLVVGTNLGIEEDDYDPHIPPGHPDEGLWAVYDFTSMLQHALVSALS